MHIHTLGAGKVGRGLGRG